ncbi:DUF3006 domain-containing protein [Halalkalicoccus salilacus]|uniref:DUF3006 domain-containing protein n=1 Tax=Halalkalicoccus sp. GCM10025704 TaxID=3252662 RepID=UPI0036147E6C
MTDDGTYTATVDRIEEGIAVCLLEDDGEVVDERHLDRERLPADCDEERYSSSPSAPTGSRSSRSIPSARVRDGNAPSAASIDSRGGPTRTGRSDQPGERSRIASAPDAPSYAHSATPATRMTASIQSVVTSIPPERRASSSPCTGAWA